MGRSHESFGKKEVRDKRDKKRKAKEKKRLERKETKGPNSLDDMIAYVDHLGNITDTPPDMSQKEVINAEDIEVGVPKNLERNDDPVRKGIVTFFNDSKGFGFIRDTMTKQDVFVHLNGLIDPIKENNKVNYELTKGPKGPMAINVTVDKS